MASRTALYDWHVAQGARMVDFAGWDMPVLYKTIVEEHQAVRTATGLFDISHMGRLSFAGPDALDLIQHVYTNNAATLKDGQVRYGLVCNEHGGIRDDVLVYRWPYGWAMVVNASNCEKIVAWLAEHKGGRNVEVSDRTTATCMVAVQGPQALCQLVVWLVQPEIVVPKGEFRDLRQDPIVEALQVLRGFVCSLFERLSCGLELDVGHLHRRGVLFDTFDLPLRLRMTTEFECHQNLAETKPRVSVEESGGCIARTKGCHIGQLDI